MASIARYLKLDFERRSLPGLKAKYNGPKATKTSGKAKGSKKKRNTSAEAKARSRHRNQKMKGKASASKGGGKLPENDGFAPLTRKKND